MKGWLRLGVVGTAAGLGLVVGLSTSVPQVGAATGDNFTSKANATALSLSVLGQTVFTSGAATATADSTQGATATGSGYTSPAVSATVTASANSPNATQSQAQTCSPLPAGTLPTLLSGLLSAQGACGGPVSASEDANGLPSSTADADVLQLSIGTGLSSLLNQLVTPQSPLASALQSVLGNVPALSNLPAGGSLLSSLLGSIGNIGSLLNVNIGKSTSTTSTTSSAVTSTAQTDGADIQVLDGLGVNQGPLLDINISNESASTTLNPTTGQVSASDDPVAVTVTYGTAATGTQTQTFTQGQSQTLLAGTPLQSTISVNSGSANPGTGQGSASAQGLSLDLLQGIGASTTTSFDGGIDLALSNATVQTSATTPSVTAASPTTTTTAPPPAAPAATPAPAVPGATSPHTGEPWAGPASMIAVGLAFLTGVALVARRRLFSLANHMAHFAQLARHRASGPPPGPTPGTSSVPPPVSGSARRQT
jgi:hypothetical protein